MLSETVGQSVLARDLLHEPSNDLLACTGFVSCSAITYGPAMKMHSCLWTTPCRNWLHADYFLKALQLSLQCCKDAIGVSIAY